MILNYLREFNGHSSSIYALSIGSNPSEFYSGGSDGQLVHWNLNDPDGNAIAVTNEAIFCLAYDPINSFLFCGTENGSLFRIELNNKNHTRLLAFHRKPVYKVLIVEKSLFAISGDGILSEIDIRTFELKSANKLYSKGLRSLVHHSVNNSLIIGAQGGIIFEFKLASKETNKIIQIESNKTVFSLAINTETSQLIVGSMDALLRVYSIIDNLEIVQEINAHWFTINDIVLANNQKIIVSASRDKTIRLWDSNNFELIKEISSTKFQGNSRSINKLLWIKSTNVLLSASDDRIIKAWTIQ
ncbi:MAG: hypothetical protein ABIO44_04890 [Saprospiraceae bacterium]